MQITFDLPTDIQSNYPNIGHLSWVPMEAFKVEWWYQVQWFSNGTDWLEIIPEEFVDCDDTPVVVSETQVQHIPWSVPIPVVDPIKGIVDKMKTKQKEMKDAFKTEDQFRTWFWDNLEMTMRLELKK